MIFVSCKKQEIKVDEEFLFEIEETSNKNFPPLRNLSSYKQTVVATTLEDSLQADFNTVYCVSLLYAWDELKKVLNEPVVIDSKATQLLALNKSKSHHDVRSREDVTFKTDVSSDLVTVFATFEKSLPFGTEFNDFSSKYYNDREGLKFKDTPVESFGIIGYRYGVTNSIEVLYYKDDNDFALKLIPNDSKHEIILYLPTKSYESMASLLTDLDSKIAESQSEKKDKNNAWKFEVKGQDELFIPKIAFNLKADFNKIKGARFSAGNKDFLMKEVTQQNAFFLDQTGAGIESIVELEAPACEEPKEKKPRIQKLHFNKPFFLMMKKKNAKRPYFALWVANTELLLKTKNTSAK
ncbi:MAG: hypothetical protein MUF43_13730 [Flavobacterium sp.]|nr:hypothetical protein [Flavobacterium sp.]